MARIKHIAITTGDPESAAAFYKEAFDLQEVSRNERQVLLSDGYINLTILRWKTEQDPDVGPDGPNYSGIHHIGFQVDDLEASCARLEKANGKALTVRDVDTPDGAPRRQRAEAKWAGPDGVVIDISQPGWAV